MAGPVDWRSRPLYRFPGADPRRWASLRKQALDAVLNADLDGDLHELARFLSMDCGHGAGVHDHDWTAFQDDLRAVVRYATEGAPRPEDLDRLADLYALGQVQFEINVQGRSTCSTLTNAGDIEPPKRPSIRTISSEVLWTVQILKDADALDVKRCRRESCARWFVDLKGYTESCSDACRIAYAQGR